MIDKETVFILGAGASAPYGYPTGAKLRTNIYNDFTVQLTGLLSSDSGANRMKMEIQKFTETFFKSSTPSIDLFLARNAIFSEMGKMAIVLNILNAEQRSTFREDIKDSTQDWYSYLFQRMTETLTTLENFKHFGMNRVSFITFNYDRSLEQFLYESLTNAFHSAPQEEILAQLRKIPIFHVYGKVAKLPWEDENNEEALEYQYKYNYSKVEELKDNIKIVYEEEIMNGNYYRDIISTLSNAERVFFLGFGYAKENLDLVEIPKILNSEKNIYGTTLALFENERVKIGKRLNKDYDSNMSGPGIPVLEDCDCTTLLRKYL